MILLCYDGSDDAKAAIARAGALFTGQPATVLAVWEPLVETMARSGAGFGYGIVQGQHRIGEPLGRIGDRGEHGPAKDRE